VRGCICMSRFAIARTEVGSLELNANSSATLSSTENFLTCNNSLRLTQRSLASFCESCAIHRLSNRFRWAPWHNAQPSRPLLSLFKRTSLLPSAFATVWFHACEILGGLATSDDRFTARSKLPYMATEICALPVLLCDRCRLFCCTYNIRADFPHTIIARRETE